ncbi:hypothetical protein JOE40_001722 [Arthrobacter sp. PvP102]|uniref:hypothetical protein n=1 Tax=unclassified Arthrobacter TaxID=235627 RepID=UPI0018DB2654|nr:MULTISPECIES: hypothetical protein [unclassified Arthrobacter]MBP1232078.1 hypothetical protein [Arthrobacter sp. PvP103]MBP1237213.1 hypothetical protein [Arthrobacter sp. PvP102]
MVIQKSEETRTLTGFHGGLRRGTAAAALGAVLVLSAGVPASNAVSLVPAPDTTDGADAAATTSVQAGVPSLDVWASVVLGPKPDPTRPSAPGNGKPKPPGQRTQPTPSPTPTTDPVTPAPSPVPTSPTPSPSVPSPSGGTVPPSGTPAPSPAGGAAVPPQAPAAPAPGTGSAPAGIPAAPPVLPGSSAPVAPATGTTTPGPSAGVPAPAGAARPSGSKAAGPAAAAPASAWKTTNMFGPANMAVLTSAGVVPLSGPGYGVSSAPVMRSAVSVSPVGELSPQVWWGAGLVALACAAGVAYVRMRRI